MKDIYIIDDFFSKELLDRILNNEKEYQEVKTPGKSFWVKKAHKDFLDWTCNKISDIEGTLISPILGFFREAKEGQDNDWRIHNDFIIEGERPDRALVVYLSEDEDTKLNGTAFWEHKVYGDSFKPTNEDLTEEEFNNLIINDSNNLDLWTLKSVIGHKQGRLISYPCSYFHSKYPNEFINSRQVFVMFYKT
jgi:hypothetical protein